MSSKAKKEYTPEQRAEAVQLALSAEQSVSQVARNLGMAESTLQRWVHQHKVDSQSVQTDALTTIERQELQRLRQENKQLAMERDFLTAVALSGGTPPTPCLKKAAAFLSWLCWHLQVARSGFYRWLAQLPSARQQQDQQLAGQIQAVFETARGSYGSPRIHHQLRQHGWSISRKRVIRLMQQLGLVARPLPRRSKTKTTGAAAVVAENLLQRQFEREHPDQAWVGDITYLPTTEGWRYLAVWIDLFSRRVVGWSFAEHLRTELVVETLHRALGQRQPHPQGLLVHSDQGCQYTSHAYQHALQTAGLTCSMSRRGNCWDNSVAESFFSTLKTELSCPLGLCSPDQLHAQVAFWIEGFYNQRRIHSTLGYLSPVEFEHR